jgi:hypothetical protein
VPSGLWGLAAVLLVHGAMTIPKSIVRSSLVDTAAPEEFGWANTASMLGTAGGQAASGQLV